MKAQSKRILSLLLVFVMLFSLFPTAALADEPEDEGIVYGTYDENGEWVEEPNITDGTWTDEKTGVTLSKKAEPTEDPNTYKITLTVETSTTTTVTSSAAATVLVIDVSGSMAYCAECGENYHANDCGYHKSGFLADNSVKSTQTRMYAAKQAALSFLETYRGETSGTGRYVSIVKFSSKGGSYTRVVQEWVDVSTENGYNAAVSAVNGLSANGGTYLQGGLELANSQLSKGAAASLSASQKNVIALTDGIPTYSDTYGDGSSSSCSEALLNETAGTAGEVRGNASLYTVCFGVADDSCYRDGPTVGEFLADDVATGADDEHTYAYTADNADALYEAFEAITESITSGISGEGLTVRDPMAEGVTAQLPGGGDSVTEDGDGFTWDLSKTTPDTRIEGDTTHYTYTLTYTVTLDPTAIEDFDENKAYPLNAETTLTIPGEDPYVIEFPVPGVRSELPTYTVTYRPGDHGTLADADEDGNVVYTNVKYGTETPEPPEVTVNSEEVYFSGWTPEIADTVTEDVTYTAQYATKTLFATIQGDTSTQVYDGTEHKATGYTVTLPDGYTLDKTALSYSAAGTETGAYNGVFSGSVVITDAAGNDVTYQFRITKTPGALTVTPRAITIKAGSAEKVYDGTPLTEESYELYNGNLAKDQTISSVTVIGSQTDVGSSSNTASNAMIVDAAGRDVTKNYNITYQSGTLTVLKDTRAHIAATGYTGTYDGAFHAGVTEVTLKNGKGEEISADDGWTITYVYNGRKTDTVPQFKDAGAYTVTVQGSNPNYNDVSTEVTVVVGKRPVTFTSPSDTKMYDGRALTGDPETFKASGLVEGEEVTYKDFASITNAGTTKNVINVVWGNVNPNNYDVTKEEGDLTVTKNDSKDVTLEAAAYRDVYDAQSHALITEKAVTGAVEGNTWTYAYSTDGTTFSASVPTETNAGTYPVWVKASCANYEDLTVRVEAAIASRPVTLASQSGSWSYDGNPHSKAEVEAEGFLGSDGAAYSDFASITDVGETDNTFSYILTEGTIADNYAITTSCGKLTVTPSQNASLKVTGYTGTYDGRPHGVECSVTGFVEGNAWKITYSTDGERYTEEAPTRIDAGTTTVYVKAECANYKTLTAKAEIEIGQRSVTLTSATATKSYDGTPLTDSAVTVSGMGFVEGEGVESYDVTGSQTAVGSSKNDFTYELDSNTEAGNYQITQEMGTLTVTPYAGDVSLVASPYAGMYDGAAHDAVRTYTVSGVEIEGVEWTYSFSTDGGATYGEMPRYTDVGEYPVTVKAAADNFDDVTAEVTAVITPREVVLTSGTSSKTYDGNALVNYEVAVTGDGFAPGEGAAYDVTGSQTEAGSSENTFTYALWDGSEEGKRETKESNYTVTTEPGTLTVTKNGNVNVEEGQEGVRLTATGYTGTYDGAGHPGVSGETVTGAVEGNTWAYTYSTDGKTYSEERPVFKDAGAYTVYVKAVNDNYEDLETEVAVKITPAVVTVTADGQSKLSGETDPALTYQVRTEVAGETPAFTGALSREPGETRGTYAIGQGTLALTDGEGFKSGNYSLQFIAGELTIREKGLDVVKTVSAKTAKTGDKLTYTIKVTNTGDEPLSGVTITDQMLGVDKSIGALAPGEAWTESYTYTVKASDAGKTIINTAVAKADDGTTGTGSSGGTKITRPDDDDDDDDDGGHKLNTDDHYSYIIGYKDGTIRPYGTITRGEVATIFFRLLTDETRDEYWSQTNGYSDCGPDLWCNNAISTLSSMGIIDGYQDGTFRPYAKITRAQFAKIAVGFFETTREDYANLFTDVDVDAWYTEYVEAAAREGLIQGFEDGTFRPNTNITRAQACVIVNRALGRKPDADHLLSGKDMISWPDNKPGDWFYADMQEATNSHDYTWLTVRGVAKAMESWTKKLEQRDWAAFEHAWSTAHSAPGGEVVK